MTTPLEWEKLVAELESQALAVRTSEGAKMLKSEVQEAITGAESNSALTGIIDRLDLFMMASRSRQGKTSAPTPGVLIMTRNAECDEYNNKDPGESRTE